MYTLKHISTNNGSWFRNTIRNQKRLHDMETKKHKDLGYVWPCLYLEIFLEGMFTMRAVPQRIEFDTPDGGFSLTTITNGDEIKWLVRNGLVISEVDPKSVMEWAVENYPEGIGSEGYHILAIKLLTIGMNEDKKSEVCERSFYETETQKQS